MSAGLRGVEVSHRGLPTVSLKGITMDRREGRQGGERFKFKLDEETLVADRQVLRRVRFHNFSPHATPPSRDAPGKIGQMIASGAVTNGSEDDSRKHTYVTHGRSNTWCIFRVLYKLHVQLYRISR